MTTFGFANIMFADVVWLTSSFSNSSSTVRSLMTKAYLKFGWKARILVNWPSSTAIASIPVVSASGPLSFKVTDLNLITVPFVATGNRYKFTLIS